MAGNEFNCWNSQRELLHVLSILQYVLTYQPCFYFLHGVICPKTWTNQNQWVSLQATLQCLVNQHDKSTKRFLTSDQC